MHYTVLSLAGKKIAIWLAKETTILAVFKHSSKLKQIALILILDKGCRYLLRMAQNACDLIG